MACVHPQIKIVEAVHIHKDNRGLCGFHSSQHKTTEKHIFVIVMLIINKSLYNIFLV